MAQTIKNPRTRGIVTAVLLAVCALVLGRLVLSLAGVWGGPGNTAASASAPPVKQSAGAAPSLPAPAAATGAGAAMLHLDELAQLTGRPLPDFERNPFQYGPTPEEIKSQHEAQVRAENPPPPPPPPPPPVPFMAIGYQQATTGQRVAYLCMSGAAGGPAAPGTGAGGHCAEDQQPYAVRDGQEFGQHFKVLRITDSMVEVEDESYHQTVQLPFPQ